MLHRDALIWLQMMDTFFNLQYIHCGFDLLLASVYSLTFWIVFDNVEKRVLLIILMLLHLFYCGFFLQKLSPWYNRTG